MWGRGFWCATGTEGPSFIPLLTERAMSQMRAVQVSSANGPFELVVRDTPSPGPRQVRIKVQACGICHSDSFTKMGAFPGMQFPRVPGHEVVGLLDAVGSEVPEGKGGNGGGAGGQGAHRGPA